MCYQHQPTANFFGFWQKSQLHEQISRFTQSRVLFPIKKRWPAVGRMRLQVAFKSFSPTTRAMRRSSDREASANRFPSASWKPIIRSKGSCKKYRGIEHALEKTCHIYKKYSLHKISWHANECIADWTWTVLSVGILQTRVQVSKLCKPKSLTSHVLDHHNSCERCWVIKALGFSQLGIAKRFARGGNHLARSHI